MTKDHVTKAHRKGYLILKELDGFYLNDFAAFNYKVTSALPYVNN